MKTRTIVLSTALCTVLAATPALAQAGYGGHHGSRYYDYAKVVHVEPIVRVVRVSEPRRECWEEVVSYRDSGDGYKSYTPTILGSIAGAALGYQVGRGDGRKVGAVAGGVLGGSLGRDLHQRYKTSHGGHRKGYETVCEEITDYHTEERIDGYRVKYRYNGRVYTTRTSHDPGKRLRVQVTVVPAE